MIGVKMIAVGDAGMFRFLQDKPKVEQATQRAIVPKLFELSKIMVFKMQETIDTRGASSGVSWAPLSPWTVRRKGHDRPLIETGVLRGAISPMYVFRQGRVGYKVIINPWVYYHKHPSGWGPKGGVAVDKVAAWQEFGFVSNYGVRVPGRPFFGPTVQAHLMPSFFALVPAIFVSLLREFEQGAKGYGGQWIASRMVPTEW